MCQVTTDNASNFVKSFIQFQQREARESGLIQMVMEKEVDESETTTTGDDLPVGREEEEEEEEDEEESFVGSVIPRFDDEAHALWVFRKTFQMLDDNLSIVPTGEVERAPESDLEDIYWRANRTACRQIDDDDGYETA